MKTALLLPGQGALEPGTGRTLLREDPWARTLVAQASAAVDVDLARVVERGGAALSRTEVVQPLLAAVSLAAWRACERAGVRVDLVAGHSFGDLVALAIAAGLPDEDTVDRAVARGRIFAEQARAWPGGMLALTTASGFHVSQAPDVQAHVAAEPALALAAVNAPAEWVLSGSEAALAAAQARFGGRRLDVGGPWHHPALAAGATAYGALLAGAVPPRLGIPMVSCLDGAVVCDGEEAVDRVTRQCVAPVRWDLLLAALRAEGVTHLVCCGAERVLRGLVRLNGWRDVTVLPAVDPRSVARCAEVLSGSAPASR